MQDGAACTLGTSCPALFGKQYQISKFKGLEIKDWPLGMGKYEKTNSLIHQFTNFLAVRPLFHLFL